MLTLPAAPRPLTVSLPGRHPLATCSSRPAALVRSRPSRHSIIFGAGSSARPAADCPRGPARPCTPALPTAPALPVHRHKSTPMPRASVRTMATSATAEIETAGPFGQLSPACALTLAVLVTAGRSYVGPLDMPQVLALGVVLAAALSQLNSSVGTPEVPVLAGASLALVTLGYGPIEWASAVVFGVALCSRLPQIPVYVGWLTLALATWQGFVYQWFVAAYAWYFLPGVVEAVQNKNVPVLPALCVITSMVTLVSRFNTDLLAFADPLLWTSYIVIGAVVSHLIQGVLSFSDKK